MSDISLNNITSGYNLSKINDNFDVVEEVINNEVLHTVGGNNTMSQQLDMDSYKILNLPAPTSNTEPLRKGDIVSDATGATVQYVDDSIEESIQSKDLISIKTLQQAINNVSAQEGDYVYITERGGLFKYIPSTASDNITILECNPPIDLSIQLAERHVTSTMLGFESNGTVDQTDRLLVLDSMSGVLDTEGVYIDSDFDFTNELKVSGGSIKPTLDTVINVKTINSFELGVFDISLGGDFRLKDKTFNYVSLYGVDIDGQTDYTDKMQYILDRGGKILLPSGTITVNEIEINLRNTQLIGKTVPLFDNDTGVNPATASTLQSASTNYMLTVNTASSSVVSGINFKPTAANGEGSCLRAFDSPRTIVSNCSINGDFTDGIFFDGEGMFNAVMDRIVVAGVTHYGDIFKSAPSSNNVVMSNLYTSSLPPNAATVTRGIYVENNANYQSKNCTIQGSSVGIELGSTSNASIEGFYTENTSLPIKLGSANRVNNGTKITTCTLKMAYDSHPQSTESYSGILAYRARGLEITSTTNNSITTGVSFVNIRDGFVSYMTGNLGLIAGIGYDFLANDLITAPTGGSAAVNGEFYSDTPQEFFYQVRKRPGEFGTSYLRISRDSVSPYSEVVATGDLPIQEIPVIFDY